MTYFWKKWGGRFGPSRFLMVCTLFLSNDGRAQDFYCLARYQSCVQKCTAAEAVSRQTIIKQLGARGSPGCAQKKAESPFALGAGPDFKSLRSVESQIIMQALSEKHQACYEECKSNAAGCMKKSRQAFEKEMLP